MTNYAKILKNNGFEISKENDGHNLQQYTPAGEDWNIYLNKLKDLKEYAENFAPEEEFIMWVEAKRSGFAGVPEIDELWQDQLWKQKLLSEIAKRL